MSNALSNSDLSDFESILGSSSQEKDEQLCFVVLLEEYKVLFDKRMIPKIKSEKEEALKNLTANFNRTMKKNSDTKQILKKFNNMKTKVKRIVDVKRTGNKKIKLCEWQRRFYDLWNVENNPMLHKVPEACQAGECVNEMNISKRKPVNTKQSTRGVNEEISLVQLQKACLKKQIEAPETQISVARVQQSAAEAQERTAIALEKICKNYTT
ncbi:hypothetical protein ABEB36_009211 [Hypothenemus hampei]|uniref:Regulatory protein zeste n=1 Tax=Hypothenemus hampei TaxID=57062 RepID=A0ABD1ESH0_HYPHA